MKLIEEVIITLISWIIFLFIVALFCALIIFFITTIVKGVSA